MNEKNYLVTFTPLEPYFFGNEKTFAFAGETGQGQKTNSYFIASEQIPMQTTILGALRFLHLNDKIYEAASCSAELIGSASFVIRSKGQQSFGEIAEISPLFLVHTTKENKKEIYIITPTDNKSDTSVYVPLQNYKPMEVINEKKEYTKEYNPKADHSPSVMSVDTSKTITIYDLISGTVRTGNAKGVEKGGFFKKKFCILKKGWSFAVAAKLHGNWETGTSLIYLGQNKSLFSVNIEESSVTEDDIRQKAKKWLRSGICYVWGDSYVSNEVYKHSTFSITETREYREFSTESGAVKKGETLYSLVKSGSIFKTNEPEIIERLFDDPQCCTIGFNKIIIGG